VEGYIVTLEEFKINMPGYIQNLSDKEKSQNTINKYSLAVNNFIAYAEKTKKCEEICKDCFIRYKEHLKAAYKPKTVNLYIVGLNQYLKYLGTPDLCIKSLNIQSNNSLDNCITNDEYKRMLDAAKKDKNITAYYVMRTLACTGMRIKGLSYITVKVLQKGSFTVTNKGKIRSIVIPNKICKELLGYCAEMDISDGYVFCGRNPQKIVHDSTVWRWCKKVATAANVDESKVFPHNLRHLFAREFMEVHNDLPELADILGHSNLETTRIYTRTSVEDKRNKMETLDL